MYCKVYLSILMYSVLVYSAEGLQCLSCSCILLVNLILSR